MNRLPTLIGVAQALVGDHWLKRFHHKRSSAVATAFVTMQKIGNAKCSLQLVSENGVHGIDQLVGVPEFREYPLPTIRV